MNASFLEHSRARARNRWAVKHNPRVQCKNVDDVARARIRLAARVRLRQRVDLLRDLLFDGKAWNAASCGQTKIRKRDGLNLLDRDVGLRRREVHINGSPIARHIQNRHLQTANAVAEESMFALASQNKISESNGQRTVEERQ